MNELLNWLLQQKGSMNTYLEFHDHALEQRAAEPQHAALLRLLPHPACRSTRRRVRCSSSRD